MSFMRYSSPSKWEDCDPLYVYMAAAGDNDARLTGFDGATPEQVVEVIMRMFNQSGEFNEKELERMHNALRYRLRLEDEI